MQNSRNDRLKDAIARLAQFSPAEEAVSVNSAAALPSVEAIRRIVALVKDIVFPGYIGKAVLSMIPEFITTIKAVLDSYEHSYNRSVDAIEKSQADYHEFSMRI
ncbi:MAG: hypothetical protein II375_00075, partial [Bacteroidales bacterium]|nr:hypothetical protein [Bacteroidales bacterium]